jgi:hypothetical protein
MNSEPSFTSYLHFGQLAQQVALSGIIFDCKIVVHTLHLMIKLSVVWSIVQSFNGSI